MSGALKETKLSELIGNVTGMVENGLCYKCDNYIPIQDDRIPPHFHCKKFYDYMDFPKAINEVHVYEDENHNLKCMSFISTE